MCTPYLTEMNTDSFGRLEFETVLISPALDSVEILLKLAFNSVHGL